MFSDAFKNLLPDLDNSPGEFYTGDYASGSLGRLLAEASSGYVVDGFYEDGVGLIGVDNPFDCLRNAEKN